MLKRIGLVALLLIPAALLGQSQRSATGGTGSIWAGAEMSAFNPDYGCTGTSPFKCGNGGLLLGPGVLFDFNPTAKWGVEGEARWLHWRGLGGETESNYLVGPRYRVFQHRRFDGWAKVLLGGGWITTPYYPQAGSLQGSYFATAIGGTADYRLTRRISLRGDYEYQFWPSFAGPPSYNSSTGALIPHNSGLTPNGFSVGVMYRLLGQ